jgi:hypothetical protein
MYDDRNSTIIKEMYNDKKEIDITKKIKAAGAPPTAA